MSDDAHPAGQQLGAAERARGLADVERKIQELEAEEQRLNNKIQDQSQYELSGGNFDSWTFKKDELRLGSVRHNLSKLYNERQQVERRTEQWTDFARKKAADFLRGRLPQIDEKIREKAQQEFLENFRAAANARIFEQPDAQSEQQIMEIIRDRFENAVGRAYTAQLQEGKPEGKSPPRERGLDEGNEPPEEGQEDAFGDDEYARELFNQYTPRRQRQSRTLADVNRERREALKAREQQIKGNREGGE